MPRIRPQKFVHVPHFAANPIGVEFDPEEWLARRHEGTPLTTFLPRTVHLPVSPVRGSAA